MGMTFCSMNAMTRSKDGGVFGGVAVEAIDQLLAGIADDLAGKGEAAEEIVGARLELEGALVFELADDVAPDHLAAGPAH